MPIRSTAVVKFDSFFICNKNRFFSDALLDLLLANKQAKKRTICFNEKVRKISEKKNEGKKK